MGIPGVTISGSCVSVTPASAGSLTLAPSNYLEVSLNAAGFQTLSLDFDFQSNWSQFLDLDYPWVAVNLSTDGGTTWSNIADFQVPSASTDIWLSPQYPLILPAACNNNANIKVRFYGYNSFASAGRIYIDNVTLLAASTVVNAGSKTLVNFSTVYTGVTSGLTGSLFVYDKFTANGIGSTVNLLNSNILLSNQLNVTNSGTFNFGVGGTPRYMLGNTLGTAAFNVNTSGTVGVTDIVGITATGGTLGNVQCLGTRTYGTDGSYAYFANAAQVTGNGLPATVKNLTIDNAAGVTLTGAGVTINGILGLNNGILRTATFATDNVSITNTGSVSLTNGWVYGNLQKYVATGSNVLRNFEVGTLSNYTPALITFPSVTTAGNYTARANPTTFFTGSCLSTSKYLNQIWNLANNSVLPNNYNVILDWNTAGNLVGSPTAANLIVGNYNGSTWAYPALATTPNSTTLSATGVTGSGLFQVAEGKTPSVTIAQSPTGAQCVGTSLTFTATPTNGGSSPNYEFLVNGSPVQNSGINTFTTSALANGDIVTVTITSNENCVIFNNTANAPTPITVAVNPRPSLSVTNPAAVCAPGTVNITTAATDLNGIPGSTFTYYNDSTSAVNQTGVISPAAASAIAVNGVYWVRCTTPAGCFEVRPITATINNCTTLTWEGGFGGVGNENNWNIATNWNPDFVPTVNNDIIIPNRPFDPELSTGANGFARNTTIAAGATIYVDAGYTLDIKGNWTGANNVVSGPGKTIFSGSAAQSITGGGIFSNLQVNNTNGVSVASGVNKVNITGVLELKAGQLTTNGNIRTISNASGTAYINDYSVGFAGTLSGNVAVQRYITSNNNNGFRYIGTPVVTTNGGSTLDLSGVSGFVISGTPGQTIPATGCPSNIVAMNSPYGTFMRWEEAGPFTFTPLCRQQGWWFQTTGTMTSGRGYGAKVSSGNVITYTGAAQTGNVSLPCTHTAVFSNANNGWNLVANPYPSAIKISDVDNNPNNNMPAGFDGQVQFYLSSGPLTGTYYTYNAGSSPNIPITALGQGFWVRKTNPGTGNFVFTNGHRRDTLATYYDDNSHLLHNLDVMVSGNGYNDVTYIYFMAAAQTGFDYYDGQKWESRAEQPTLYTKVGSEMASINSLPSLQETVVVPMGLKPGTNGNFTFTFDDIATFPQTTMIFLEDLKLGTMVDLRNNNSYNFNMTINDDANRFMLHFQPGLQAEVADQDCDNAGSIELTQPAPTVWSTYEVRGNDNNVYAQGTNFTGSVSVTNLPPQEYVVSVTHASGYTAQEFITVNGNSQVDATINASATNVMVDEMVSLTGVAADANEYVWNFGDGNTQSGSSSVVHAYDAEGIYTVSMTASNSTCNDVATKVINVSKSTTGIDGIDANNINIYGQGERVVIEFNNWGGNKADIFMYNALGQRMESLTGVSTLKGRQELYIADIVPGTYFIQVISDGKIQGKKVFLGKQ
ncbi:MAG: PKD domain-containing protein [Sphingobacteriales bacterium JAD_PAG50586_3]|nr:MAG: PKD domain-containing protein [Sphingobacteriales bacterium JAD_PAG50586_3]